MGDKLTLAIKGMHCAGCAANIEAALRKIGGVSDVGVNFVQEKAYIEYDPRLLTPQRIRQAIKDAGYIPSDDTTNISSSEDRLDTLRMRLVYSAALAAPLIYLAAAQGFGLPIPAFIRANIAAVQFLLCTPIIFAGREFFLRGIRAALKTRQATMDTLIALGVGSLMAIAFISPCLS
ncbi:MAG: cation transporter [Candidatus Omnitrophota bacterium]